MDITNDGQQSSTDPVMNLDPETGRVSGEIYLYTSRFNSDFNCGQVGPRLRHPLDLGDSVPLRAWTSKEMGLSW